MKSVYVREKSDLLPTVIVLNIGNGRSLHTPSKLHCLIDIRISEGKPQTTEVILDTSSAILNLLESITLQ